MRDDKDFLSYKTYVYNFFNSSNFFNFTQVEPAKLEYIIIVADFDNLKKILTIVTLTIVTAPHKIIWQFHQLWLVSA